MDNDFEFIDNFERLSNHRRVNRLVPENNQNENDQLLYDLDNPCGEPIEMEENDILTCESSDRYTYDPNKNAGISYIPAHLSSPIYDHEIEFIQNLKKPKCHRHRKLKKFFSNKEYNLMKDVCTDPMSCLNNYIDQEILCKGNTMLDIQTQMRSDLTTAMYSTELQDGHLSSNVKIPGVEPGIKIFYKKLNDSISRMVHELFGPYTTMKKVEVIKDYICYKEILLGDMLSYRNLYVERDVMLIKCESHGWVAGPTNLLLCALDKAQSRFTLLLYWILSDVMDKYSLSMYDLGLRLINVFERLRSQLGESFYTLMNSWESLVLGKVVTDPQDIKYQGLYEASYNSVIEVLASKNLPFTIIEEITPQNQSSEEYRLWLEMVGISKIFGHPVLEIDHLLDDLKAHGSIHGNKLNCDIIDRSVAIGKRDFILNYFNKHNYYPKIIKTSIAPVLIQYLDHNRLIPKNFFTEYHLWRPIIFEKNLEYDFSPDTSDLIKDSAAAFPWSAWGSNYDPCAFEHWYKKCPPPKTISRGSRRIIEQYLTGDDEEVFKKISDMCNLIFDPDDLTAEQCGKENELKTKIGRAFVKQTYWNRLYQVSLEHNVASNFFPYVPEQSMTDPEIISMRRILNNVSDLESNQCEKVNLDLKKWNIKFRHELVEQFGEILDQLFETPNLYQYNHLWFLKSHIVTNSRLHPPDYDGDYNPIEGPYYYRNHYGGMEGMRQKFWTWITINLIKLSAEECGISISLMGQGDNQVIIIHYTWEQLSKSDSIRTSFMNHLSNTFQSVGLELKQAETWASKYVHEYGRTRFYMGIAISQGTKKCARLVPDANESYPTFSSPISTINTLTESISQKDSSPIAAYIINQFSVLNYLRRKGIIKGSKVISRSNNIIYLLIPADFGGLSVSSLFDHIIRGHNDKVTCWLSFYYYLKNHDLSLFSKITDICQLLPRDKIQPQDKERLIHDIYCLNIDALPTLENEIKDLAMQYLKSDKVTNPQIKQLYHPTESLSEKDLINILLTMDPFYPPLVYMLFELSNAGTLLALQKKMMTVSTVNKLIQRTHGVSFIQYMMAQNLVFADILRNRMKKSFRSFTRTLFEDFECPTQLAQYLRIMSWDLNIIGLTKPFPVDQVEIRPWDCLSEISRGRSISVTISDKQRDCPNIVDYEPGPYPSYVGSITKDKIKKPTLDVRTKTIWIKSVKQLGTILSWAEKLNSESLMKICLMLIREKVPVLPEGLTEENICDWTTRVWGGSIFHRFFATIEKSSAVINFLSNLCSHFRQSTNEMAVHTSGGADYTIFYQLIFLFNMYNINRVGRLHGSLPSNVFGAELVCPNCTIKVPDDIDLQIIIPSKVSPVVTPRKFDYLAIHFQYNFEDMSKLVEYHISKILGLNVDRNFIRGYKRYDTNIKTDDVLKVEISINDIRPLCIRRLLFFITIHSDHLTDIIAYNSYPEYSTDSSAAFISQLIFNSGLKNKILAMYPNVAFEHTEITTVEGFSPLLLRIIKYHVLTNLPEFFSTICSVNLTEETTSHKLKMMLRMKKISTFMKNRNFSQQLNRAIGSVNKNSILHCSKIITSIFSTPYNCVSYTIDDESILLLWRMYPKIGHLIDQNQITKIPPLRPTIRIYCYPFSDVLNFYKSRFNSIAVAGAEISTLCHIARPVGNISSAWSKSLEIIHLLDLDDFIQKCSDNIYCLAEGSGSTVLGFYSRYLKTKVGYTTLINSTTDKRNDMNDIYPPALLNAGCLDTSRFILPQSISCGETNILHDTYISKITEAFSQYPPHIVTIDAESIHLGDNFEFVRIYVPLLIAFNVSVMIIKVFYTDYYMEKLTDLTKDISDDYTFLFCKPISSSTVSREVFLIGMRTSIIPNQPIVNILIQEQHYLGYLNNIKPLDSKLLRSYCELARRINGYLVNNSISSTGKSHCLLNDKYSTTINELKCCGYWCKKLISYIMGNIHNIHHADDNNMIFPVIRKRGTNQVLRFLIKDLVFILTFIDMKGNIPATIDRLIFRDINDLSDIRKGISKLVLEKPEESLWFRDWPNGKMFFRNSVHFDVCMCPRPYVFSVASKLHDHDLIPKIFSELKVFSSSKNINLYNYIETKY